MNQNEHASQLTNKKVKKNYNDKQFETVKNYSSEFDISFKFSCLSGAGL